MEVRKMVTFVILALILAQGNGFVVTPSDIRPYWQTYSKSHGFPSEIQEKRECGWIHSQLALYNFVLPPFCIF